MILSITSLKGGVGKSTIAQNLAVWLAHQDYSVCIIDTDENQSSSHWSGIRNEVLPSITVVGMTDSSQLMKNINPLHQNYDVVIIDGTPSLSEIATKIILLGDIVLIPIVPSGLDVWATGKFIDRYETAKNLKEENIPAYFLLNQYDSKINLSQEVKEVLGSYDIELLQTTLKNRVAYKEAVIKGLGVIEYSNEKAKAEIEVLGKEILKVCEASNLL